MRKNLFSVLLAAIISLILSGAALADTVATTNVNLNFRDAPSLSSDVNGVVPVGTSLPVEELTNPYWIRVSYNGQDGYVSRNYVTINQTVSKAQKIIAYGETFQGVPYQWGGNSPVTGFDCSGFVHYIFAHYGVNVTRQSTASAANDGYWVSYANMQPGDLVYFYTPVHHIGVYIGNGQILHTYKPGIGVTISSIAPGSFWYNHLTTIKRVL